MTALIPLKRVAIINRSLLSETTELDHVFKYLDIGQIDSNGNVLIPDDSISFASAPSRARRLAPRGATAISTVRTYLRAIGRVPASDEAVVLSTGFAIAEARPGIDPDFLYFACRSDDFVDSLVARSVGVSYPAIAPSSLGEIRIPVPPIDEQRRIAEFLDREVSRIDSIVACRQQQVGLTRASIEAVAHAEVTGQALKGRRPSTLAWARSLPAAWGEPRICWVARMGTGHTPSRSEPTYWLDCTIPWLTTSDVHRFRGDEIDTIEDTAIAISQLGLENSAAVLHPKGTVALSRTASAGFAIVMGADMATSQDYATWTCGPQLHNHFLLWCLRAMRRDLMGRLATGSTHKTIYFPELKSIRIPLPSYEEQEVAVRTIRDSVDAARAVTGELEASIALLEEYKRSLITQAVSGELDVTTASGKGLPA